MFLTSEYWFPEPHHYFSGHTIYTTHMRNWKGMIPTNFFYLMRMPILILKGLQHYTSRTSALILKYDIIKRVLYNITGNRITTFRIKLLDLLTYILILYFLFQIFHFNISMLCVLFRLQSQLVFVRSFRTISCVFVLVLSRNGSLDIKDSILWHHQMLPNIRL
jgi:hypothetical protein